MSTYDQVKKWNINVGKITENIGTDKYWDSIQKQFILVQEEFAEVYEAIKNRDIPNLLKEGADLDVVVAGLNYLAGSDYNRVIGAVSHNNALKVTTDKTTAEGWVQYHKDKGNEVELNEVTVDSGSVMYSVIDSSGKIRKPPNHPEVDLSSFVPEMFTQKLGVTKNEESLTKEMEDYCTNNNIPIIYIDEIDENKEVFEGIFDQFGEVVLNIKNTTLDSVEPIFDLLEG